LLTLSDAKLELRRVGDAAGAASPGERCLRTPGPDMALSGRCAGLWTRAEALPRHAVLAALPPLVLTPACCASLPRPKRMPEPSRRGAESRPRHQI